MRLTFGLLSLLILYLAAGCGLSDYEKRMDQQSLALKLFDEENKTLGDPLDFPMLIDVKSSAAKPILLVEFFLRPPKGTQSKPKNPEKESPGKVPLICYSGPAGNNVLVSTFRIAQDAKVPKKVEGQMTPKEFQHQVREALARFYEKEIKKPIDWSRAEKTEKKTVQVPSGKGPLLNLIFDYQTLTDDPDPGRKTPPPPGKTKDDYHDFRLFFYQTGIEQAAIVYQIPSLKRNDSEINKAVEFSIRSLALGMEASKKRQEFNKRKKR